MELPYDPNEIIKIAQGAAREIIEVKQTQYKVGQKENDTPVTAADFAAAEYINERLEAFGWPIINEETKDAPYSERKSWEQFWSVDPLDGTKEFIKSSDEYTVNIAYIENKTTIWGVIVQPENGITYCGGKDFGTIKIVNGKEEKITVQSNHPKKIFISRSHHSEEVEKYIASMEGEVEKTSCGSSLKFCKIAEGAADAYPRFGPTMEWDTCAGQAILEGAGGSVMDWETKQALQYNKENLLNPFFVAENK